MYINSSGTVTLVMIGGGPRALGILERVLAQAPEMLENEPAGLSIHIVDPYPLGGGHVWREDQDPHLLMNSRACDVTIFTDDTFTGSGPVRRGPSLAEWAQGEGAQAVANAPELAAECARIASDPRRFASRRLNAHYLHWAFEQVTGAAPEGVAIEHHAALAKRITGSDGNWLVTLDDGTHLPANLLVATVGHVVPEIDERAARWSEHARRHGLIHIPPSHTQDADLDVLPAGEDVLVEGMGLAFVDLVSLVTEGRGGRFREGESGSLEYEPSGKEPVIWAGSGRGVLYQSKKSATLEGPRPVLQHLTLAKLESLYNERGPLSFDDDVMDLVERDVYAAVADAGLPTEGRSRYLRLREANQPLSAHRCETAAEVEKAVVDYTLDNLEYSVNSSNQETAIVFDVLLKAHVFLSEHLPVDWLDEPSRRQFPAYWNWLFSFHASGPPPHRVCQILALHRQGVVRFVGPSMWIRPNETGFAAGSRNCSADVPAVESRILVQAHLPKPLAGHGGDRLQAQLVDDGLASVDTRTGKLAIDRATYRVLDHSGRAHETFWAAGPHTAENPVGAFARPGVDASIFRYNDRVAGQIWETVGADEVRKARVSSANASA